MDRVSTCALQFGRGVVVIIGVGDLVGICSPQYSRIYLSALDRSVAALDLELDNRPQGPDFEGFAEVVD